MVSYLIFNPLVHFQPEWQGFFAGYVSSRLYKAVFCGWCRLMLLTDSAVLANRLKLLGITYPIGSMGLVYLPTSGGFLW